MQTSMQTAGMVLVHALVPDRRRKKLVRRRVVLPYTGQAPDRAAESWASRQPLARVIAVRKDGTRYVGD